MTGLPDIAFRIHGAIETLVQNKPQNLIFLFRPCYIDPPGLPADFYELNGINCTGNELAVAYSGATGAEEKVDPLCLWSVANAFEFNPPTIYVGYDDPCFEDGGEDGGGVPGTNAAGEKVLDLYSFVSVPGEVAVFVRVDMEKGKRLNTALQPENVASAGAKLTGVLGIGGTAAGFLGGDPVAMLQDVQNMATSGQINVPVNPGMRDFMSKFGWANFGFLNPPPQFLIEVRDSGPDSA